MCATNSTTNAAAETVRFYTNVVNICDPATSSGISQTTARLAVQDISGTAVRWYFGNSVVGTVALTGTTTTYNTSSDYRLKENVNEMHNSLEMVSQLKPCEFNFIGDSNVVQGFLAHEVQQVVPQAVTGTKDEVDSDGNPVYQTMDYSRVTPLLTAALQETIKQMNALKLEIQELKTQVAVLTQ
jgi:hypothetical protein